MNDFLHNTFQNIEKIYYFLAIGGVLVAIVGLPILWWYADETYQLRVTAQKQLIYSARPFLDFIATEPRYTVKNKSNNVATNIFVFSKLRGQYYFIDNNQAVGSALQPNGQFFIGESGQQQIASTELVVRIPSIKPLIEYLDTKGISFNVVVYEDLYNNKLYTVIFGSGDAYETTIETGYIKDLKQ